MRARGVLACSLAAAAAAFGAGCAADSEAPQALVCISPAPLAGRFDARAPGYVVRFRAGVDPQTESARLADNYMFTPSHVFLVIPGFAAEFDDDVREQLRCEPSIRDISFNAVVGI